MKKRGIPQKMRMMKKGIMKSPGGQGEGWLRADFGGSHPLPAQNPTAETLQLTGLPGGYAMTWTRACLRHTAHGIFERDRGSQEICSELNPGPRATMFGWELMT